MDTDTQKTETFGDILRDMDFGRIPPHVCDVEITKHYAERIKAAINRAREDGLLGDDQFAPHYLLSAQKPSDIEQRDLRDAQKAADVAHGNAARMREVLGKNTEEAYLLLDILPDEMISAIDAASNVLEESEAALSAPARNCDVVLIENLAKRNIADIVWAAFRETHPKAYLDVPGLLQCINWLFDKAEGGAK